MNATIEQLKQATIKVCVYENKDFTRLDDSGRRKSESDEDFSSKFHSKSPSNSRSRPSSKFLQQKDKDSTFASRFGSNSAEMKSEVDP